LLYIISLTANNKAKKGNREIRQIPNSGTKTTRAFL